MQTSSSMDDSDEEYASVGIPIQTRPTAIYTDIGSSDDLPRSVAICPNRKCVAFGCRLGIELHWVDALTGGDLSRWFPLGAPSDCLYFMPPRPGVDSRKKLRLISSTADAVQGGVRAVECDHFRAVPISDGSHVLFTDPTTGLLCLGSDTPSGGPTKLLRKVMFSPPTSEGGERSMPLLYSAGQALEWGVRVVAFHTDGQVVLYNVPSDLFQQLQAPQTTTDPAGENPGVLSGSDLWMLSQFDTHPLRWTTSHDTARSDHDTANRYIRITGAVITRVEKDFVDGFAVNTEGGGFSLWIFYRSGRGELRQLCTPSRSQRIMRYVGDDRFVYEMQDAVRSDSAEACPQGGADTKSKGKAPRRTQVKWAHTPRHSSI